jgi:putative sigma-54 modulation protein
MRENDNISIQTLHTEVDSGVREFVWNKMDQLNKIYNRIENCDVILKKDHDGKNQDKIVEVNLIIPHKTLFSKNQAETFEQAADLVVEQLKAQLVKYKEKHYDYSGTTPIDEEV